MDGLMIQICLNYNPFNLVGMLFLVIMRGGLNGGSGELRVTNCANLISIDIGELTFMKYKYLELVDLPLLQRVKMESNAFQNIQIVLLESNIENELMK